MRSYRSAGLGNALQGHQRVFEGLSKGSDIQVSLSDSKLGQQHRGWGEVMKEEDGNLRE